MKTKEKKEEIFSLRSTMSRNMLNDKTVIFSLPLHISGLPSECDPSCRITVMLDRIDPIIFQASLLSLLGLYKRLSPGKEMNIIALIHTGTTERDLTGSFDPRQYKSLRCSQYMILRFVSSFQILQSIRHMCCRCNPPTCRKVRSTNQPPNNARRLGWW